MRQQHRAHVVEDAGQVVNAPQIAGPARCNAHEGSLFSKKIGLVIPDGTGVNEQF